MSVTQQHYSRLDSTHSLSDSELLAWVPVAKVCVLLHALSREPDA